MRSNIIKEKLNIKVNNKIVYVKFYIYCDIVVTSIYNNNRTLINQYVLEPNKFWNYEEFKDELLYTIYKDITADLNLPQQDKFKLEFTHNAIINILSDGIDKILYHIKVNTNKQESNQIGYCLSNEDTHINLLVDFINLKEKYDGKKN